VNPARYTLRNRIPAHALLLAELDLQNIRFVLNQLADGFAADPPLFGQV
jgi:hypothetical protein